MTDPSKVEEAMKWVRTGGPAVTSGLYVVTSCEKILAAEVRRLRVENERLTGHAIECQALANASDRELDALKSKLSKYEGVVLIAKECVRQHGLCGWECNWCDLSDALTSLEAEGR